MNAKKYWILVIILFALLGCSKKDYSTQEDTNRKNDNQTAISEAKPDVQVEGEIYNVKTDLPQNVIEQRNSLLSEADTKIRSGLIELADKFPQLKKARDYESIISGQSTKGQILIWLRHAHKGKAKTTKIPVPENEQSSVLVMLLPPPEKVWAMALGPVYANLGIVGQVNAMAGNPELDAALKKLVAEALKPLKRLDESLNDEKLTEDN